MHARVVSIPSRLAITCLFALSLLPAQASSKQAWGEHDKDVVASCLRESGFKQPRAISAPVEFDDRVGYSALLVEGIYPQAHMKGRRGQVLCLFDKLSHEVYFSELALKPAKVR